jgi:hypothetical protein
VILLGTGAFVVVVFIVWALLGDDDDDIDFTE